MLARGAVVQLCPGQPPHELPFSRILREWRMQGFGTSCRESLERALRESDLPLSLFRPDGLQADVPLASPQLLYPTLGPWTLVLAAPDGGRVEFTLEDEQVEAAADFLRLASRSDDDDAIRDVGGFVDRPFLDRLLAAHGAPGPSWSRIEEPGIYRREHACLEIASETTLVRIDPLRLAMSREVPATPGPDCDAILVTHQHTDHWHLPTILQAAATPDTPVVVPRVPTPSLLCPERFEESLSRVGQRAVVAGWGSTLEVGDIEIDVLPFYGEQPTRVAPGAPRGVRSWGNCYRVKTPTFSALVLVDSGADPDGDMLDVVRRSAADRGPVDVVLSCLRTFACPFFGGLATYWPTLSFERLRELWQAHERGALPSTTAGPEGVAEICRACDARYFLPYAHGFAGAGVEIDDIGWGTGEAGERAVLTRLIEALGDGASTRVVAWRPGDGARLRDGELVVEPCGGAPRTGGVP